MEEGRIEVEFDEFERLLCEIPNVTSVNSHSEQSAPKRMSLNDNLSPICATSCKGPSAGKFYHNVGLDEGKLIVNETMKSAMKRVPKVAANLPDDQSLTSAFAELNFSNRLPVATDRSLLENRNPSPNHAIRSDCQYPQSLKKQLSNIDSQVMVVPPFQSPNYAPCVSERFDGTKDGLKSSNFLKLDAEGGKKLQAGCCQPVEDLSALPLVHGVQGFQLVSNTPAPGLEFHVLANQQQYYADTRSPFAYLHSQHLSQPQISWRNVKDEQCYRMHPQYLYLQQLRNQQVEVQHPLSQNMRQSYFEMPFSYQLEQSNHEPFSNNYVVPRALNQSNPTYASSDINSLHFLDKLGKESFPEKILTRSQGLNTIKAIRFGSVVGSESVAHANQSGKVLSNGFLRHSLHSPSTLSFQLDTFSSWCAPDNTDLKISNSRSQPQKFSTLDEVRGRIYLIAKDQHGCRFLQKKISEGTPEDVKTIFLEIIDDIVELMTDPFGNYLVQKLLEVCKEDQRMQILQSITLTPGDLIQISCDMHGTRAVQKVIETLKTPEQFSMVVSSLKPGILTLIKNINGNHVAQRCLQYFMPDYSEFLFEAATANCVEIATDRHGCCVLQKCLSHSDGEQRRRLISEIISNALILSQDPFGNYVVQFVFELQLPWATVNILDQLEGNYWDLSMQKYSSNVVEKCLKYAGEERCARIIRELINNHRLDQVMQDPYGNYVIQAALRESKGPLHAALVDAIRPLVPVLRTSPYGKKVLSSNILKK